MFKLHNFLVITVALLFVQTSFAQKLNKKQVDSIYTVLKVKLDLQQKVGHFFKTYATYFKLLTSSSTSFGVL